MFVTKHLCWNTKFFKLSYVVLSVGNNKAVSRYISQNTILFGAGLPFKNSSGANGFI